MEDILIPIFAIGTLFIGFPWIILHYLTRWKQASSMTVEDENLLDELHDISRRLEDRMKTIERIVELERLERTPDSIATLEMRGEK